MSDQWTQPPGDTGSSGPPGPSAPPPMASGPWSPPGPYGQPQWPGQGPPPYGYPPPQRTNGLAVASLVLGILWIYWIGSILALIFGYVAKGQIRADPRQQGAGMATAGIVLGWVGVGILLLIIAFGVIAASTAATTSS